MCRIQRKQIILSLIIFIISIQICFPQNSFLSYEDDGLVFQYPSELLDYSQFPLFRSYADELNYRKGKIVYNVTKMDIGMFQKQKESLLSKDILKIIQSNNKVTETDIYDLFQKGATFVLTKYFSMAGQVKESYGYVYDGAKQIRGESFFSASSEELLANGTYQYTINLLYNETVYSITLNLVNTEKFNRFPDIFEQRKNKKWYWKSRESPAQFYELLRMHDKTLPKQVLALEHAFEMILSTIEFK
ncbi:hypothetical protein K7I13_10105 [Brucepastera parasyntrophica]|uniref:hypothetical protein n=1 Tax=Brucepastera parasyntrophica TaxID=2880008 RepID=UPI0021093429|nr:hypothetical protein [Brucepastera parasyntrophica]ULQ58879.1 hypothetical protein K7I13_10105 [Brucepastera parasyntrophica]